MIKKYKGEIIFYYAVVIAALICASFFDLKLDIALNNTDNIFAIWFKNTGEIPSYLLCPLAGAIMMKCFEKRILKAVGLALSIGGGAVCGIYLSDYFFIDDNKKTIFGIVFGIGISVCLLYMMSYIEISDNLRRTLIILALVGIAVLIVELGVINISKVLWGRVRFRDLLAEGSYDKFTAWYHPNGINGNKSFPSGHTAGAGISYLMMLLPYVNEKYKSHKLLCFAIPFVYTAIVGYTRLVMGAHYLSDVTIGGTVSFTIVIIAIAIIDKKQKASA